MRRASKGNLVGTVAVLSRFPVKSMAGERRAELELGWAGIHGDRQFAFYRVHDRSRFPWLSARDLPGLVLHRPAFCQPAEPARSFVDVLLPSGERLPLDALAARLSEEAGAEVRLMQLGRGIFDAMPVSLASAASLAAVDAAHGTKLGFGRFRFNIVIDSSQADLAWRSGRLAFGADEHGREEGAQLLVNDAIPRCALITIDPDTARRDASVMRTVAQDFANRLGVYCAVARPGIIRVGDPVRLVEPPG